MKTLSELYLGHLNSQNIGELIEEMKSLNLDLSFPVDAYYNAYLNHRNISRSCPAKILSVLDTARVVKGMQDPWGSPTSYEVKNYFGKTAMKPVFYGSSKLALEAVTSPARIVFWHAKTLWQAIAMSRFMESLKVVFYVGNSNAVKVFCPEDCFIPVLLNSDSPVIWEKENARKWAQLQTRRRIKQVNDKLDRKAPR